MSREEWRNKIAQAIDDPFMIATTLEELVLARADAVLALLDREGRTLWWCEGNQMAVENTDCLRGPHRRGVFIELEEGEAS